MTGLIRLLPGAAILTAFSLAVLYWMYATIGVLTATQPEWRYLCTIEKKSNVTAIECIQPKHQAG
jgi:hypothetical protein